MKKLLTLVPMFSMLAFTACGGDSNVDESSSSADDSFGTVDDLPNCVEKREGMKVLVTEDSLTYVCVSDAWEGVDFVADEKEDLPSCTANRKNKTALVNEKEKLACDGKRWSEIVEQSSSSVAESSSSVADEKSSSSEPSGNGDDSEDATVDVNSLEGVSQKGPFLRQSVVRVMELQNGKNLRQTGKGFEGRIESDDGKYKIPSISLTSQYVYITVSGYYRDETTGKASEQSITLNAITDLVGRVKANVNILSSIEYDRVYHLVTKKGLSVGKAKAQAEQEIFDAFHMDVGTKTKTEDLDVLGDSDADAALLAISILLQGGRDANGFSELLNRLNDDFASDGKWDDEKTRGSIAKWVVRIVARDSLKVFRSNVEGWNLGKVPDFEKYIGEFVEAELGFDVFAKCEDDDTHEWADADLRIICTDSKWNIHDWIVDSRDGQKYRIVKIGSQTWMAENLNYEYSEVPRTSFCYENALVCPENYGRLYTWSAAMDSAAIFSETGKGCGFLVDNCKAANANSKTMVRGVCPEGWHLPSLSDWDTLWDAVGGLSTAGVRLKSVSEWSSSVNANGKDDYGFAALTAGGFNSGTYANSGKYAYFWTSTAVGARTAYLAVFCHAKPDVNEDSLDRYHGFSVRCLRDN